MKNRKQIFLILLLTLCLALSGCGSPENSGTVPAAETLTGASYAPASAADTGSAAEEQTFPEENPAGDSEAPAAYSLRPEEEIPSYSGEAYTVLNGSLPCFEASELTEEAFENYSDLDPLGRCGAAYACLGRELMPTEKRGDISQVKPTGWKSIRYDFVDGGSLYNRCHLIGFQLAGENANEKNLITGTRYLNVEGMLPFENMAADYIKETGNHVLYRVTPLFTGNNLVADGVQMEAMSVEDDGEGILFNVFCYNVQPGVEIDYADGSASLSDEAPAGSQSARNDPDKKSAGEKDYILNTSSRKFHLPSCTGAGDVDPSNREEFFGSRSQLIKDGYSPCGRCKP